MDPVTLVLIVKTCIAVLLVVGGLIAMRYGVGLYRDGVGVRDDGTIVEIKNAKVQLKTVGAVLMLTSFGWGWLSYLASPQLAKDGSKINVALSVPPIETLVDSTSLAALSSEQLENEFKANYTPIKVNGKTAVLLRVFSDDAPGKQKSILTEWKVDNLDKLELSFRPSVDDQVLSYLPTRATVEGYNMAAERNDKLKDKLH